MLRNKADAKERIGQIQTRGAIWLAPSREFVKRANMAEKLSFLDDLTGIRDFLKIAGSNLKLQPPEMDCGKQKRRCARLAGRIGSRADRRAVESSARRLRHSRRLFEAGGRSPVRPVLQVLASQRRSTPASFPPSSSTVAASVASGRVARDARVEGSPSAVEAPRKSRPASRGRVRGAGNPSRISAESREWSGRRGSNPRRSAWEADILPLNYSRTIQIK